MTSPTFDELQLLCKEFGAGRLIAITGQLGGMVNLNVKVQTDQGFFVIRIYQEQFNPDRLAYAQEIIRKLRASGVPALLPLRNAQGKCFFRFKDHYVQTTPFVPASSFRLRSKHAYSSGKTLRKFHEILMNVNDNPPQRSGIYQYFRVDYPSAIPDLRNKGYSWTKDRTSEIIHLYERMMSRISDTDDLPATIIHGDWNPDNQLYTENGEVCCVLDFDSIQKGERIFDVAYALYFFFLRDPSNAMGRAFLDGYGRLSVQESIVLPIYIAKLALFFGSFIDSQEFAFFKQKPLIEWLISDEGMRAIQSLANGHG